MRRCACLMHSCALLRASFISRRRSSTLGTVVRLSSHVVLGSLPISNLNGEFLVVALGQELCANWAIGSRSAQLSCCVLLQCRRNCSTHWLLRSDCPSVCGWYADEMFCFIPRTWQRFRMKIDMNCDPLSVISLLGIPQWGYACCRYSFATPSLVIDSLHGMNSAAFVQSWSVIVSIESYPFDGGSFVMKSMVTTSNGCASGSVVMGYSCGF